MADDTQSTISGEKAYKQQRKIWRKGKRKAVRPFKGLAVFLAILLPISLCASWITDNFGMTFDLLTQSKRTKLVNEDESAQYFTSVYATDEERVEAGQKLSEQAEAEGAVLLKNESDSLPLAEGSKVTLFSHSSVDLVYGGTGSAGLDTSSVQTLKEGLEDQGFEVNGTMWDFYNEGAGSEYKRVAASMWAGGSYAANEVPWSVYDESTLNSVSSYGDAAIVVISRIGGEGNDLPTSTDENEKAGYLALSAEEKEMLTQIKKMKDEGTVKNIVVLINSSNAVQVDFLDDEAYGIDAALKIGGVGKNGVAAVAKILCGKVNPSGRLSDTYLVDNMSAPAMANFGAYEYSNYAEAGFTATNGNYVVYQEGIYVGYRYYETRYEDYVMASGNAGDYSYDDDVYAAFGYGLSYTDFSYSDMNVTYDAASDHYVVTVTVTNTGDANGKHAVEVYAQQPYTQYDRDNGIEKSAVELVGYGKTIELAPGQSQTVTVEVDKADLASYDAENAGTYVLDAGTYYLTIGSDAHAATNNILAAKGYNTNSTGGRMDAEGDTTLVYSFNQDSLDTTTYAVSDNGTEIENQFDNADINRSLYTGDQEITYLTRSDWQGTFPTETVSLEATEEIIKELANRRYDEATYDGEYADAEMPTLGADNNIKLIDLMDADFDDPKWDDLLDQLTAEDMAFLCGSAFHYTQPIESIGLPGTRDENGPTGLTTTLFGGTKTAVETMGLPSEDVMGCTYNNDLMNKIGEVIGEDCLAAGMSFLYGPGANIHRTAYAGRNFEYFSEDGYLSGQLLSAECTGIESKGTHVMIKHFALNDQETGRSGIGTWANEQSIREIYLRAFEDAFTEGTATGVMTSYSRVGCHWNGADEGMITGVLRNEWGCNGVVISDNSAMNFHYMDGPDGVLAGSDIFDSMGAIEHQHLLQYTKDPVVVSAMRDAVHRVAYQVLHSNAMNGIGENTTVKYALPTYYIAIRVILAINLIGLALCTFFGVKRYVTYKRANPKPKKADFI